MSSPSEDKQVDTSVAPESSPSEQLGVDKSELKVLPATVEIGKSLSDEENKEKAAKASDVVKELSQKAEPAAFTITYKDGDPQNKVETKTTGAQQGKVVLL